MLRKYKKFNFQNYEYKRINSAYLPHKAYISLCQDGKTICEPCVKVDEQVKEGQIIAFNVENGVNIHSSITGIVEAFQDCSMPNGTTSPCIIIALEGKFTYTGKTLEQKKWEYDTSNKVLQGLKQNGVINTYDGKNEYVANQIESFSDTDTTLGVVLFDADKSSTISKTSLQFYQDSVFEGSTIIAKALRAKSIIFFCDKPDTHYLNQSNVTEILEGNEYYFIQIDSKKFPSASLLKLNTSVEKEKLPDDITHYKRMDIDTTTALSAYKAVALDLPITETLVEINGSSLHENAVFIAKIGLPIKKLIEECGGSQKNPAKIIVNGLLKGTAIKDLQTPVTKYLKTITLQSRKDLQNETVSHCINCGLCRSVCPMGLKPDVLYVHKKNNIDVSDNTLLSARLCDECGLCNTTCPSRLPLYQTINELKEDSNERKI